jgi:hypothetical protein
MRFLFRLLVISVAAAAALPARAQVREPVAEVFIGGSHFRDFSGDSAWGGQSNIAVNLSERFGVEADFGAQFTTGVRLYEAMVGPRVVFRRERWSPFVHALAGVWHLNFGASGSSRTGLALGLGGGLDVDLSRRFAFRVVQADYLPTQASGQWFNNGRVGTGLVIRFGGE